MSTKRLRRRRGGGEVEDAEDEVDEKIVELDSYEEDGQVVNPVANRRLKLKEALNQLYFGIFRSRFAEIKSCVPPILNRLDSHSIESIEDEIFDFEMSRGDKLGIDRLLEDFCESMAPPPIFRLRCGMSMRGLMIAAMVINIVILMLIYDKC